jgi:ketosteroid isomerase-like protein
MAQAVIAGDLKRLEDIYAPDYVYVGSEGKQITRAERLEAFRTGRLRYLATKHTGASVRVYGDTALVQGQTHSKVLSSGREIEGDFRYVGVWVRQGGKWRIVLTQATRIAGWRGEPPNKGMKQTKLSAAWLPEWTCRLMPAPSGLDAGTASQLIPGVRPTSR